jgi:elongation factor Ts
MAITAALVKELRERTGSGMMECKRALEQSNGDIDVAIEEMRKAGLARASKKGDRTAAEGRIVIRTSDDGKQAVIVEINCETDFVTKGDDFQNFATMVADRALASGVTDLDSLSALPVEEGSSTTIDMARQELIAKIGENINIRRLTTMETAGGVIGNYLHGDRIGVIVNLNGGDAGLARDVAMHVAASNPQAISAEQVPTETLDKEKEVYVAQARESGKPDEIIEKMVEGRLRKFLAEITLVGQAFVKDPDITVGKLLDGASASVIGFTRFEVGEGIEKKEENFAEEVMAQVKGG